MAGEKEIKLADVNTVKKAIGEVLFQEGLPSFHGPLHTQIELLERLGYFGPKKKEPGKIYDDLLGYYVGNQLAWQIFTGLENEDETPVGKVTQRAPLDITSVLYPIGLGAQVIEELYDLFKLAGSEPDANAMQKTIWDIEKESGDPLKNSFLAKLIAEEAEKKGAPEGAVPKEEKKKENEIYMPSITYSASTSLGLTYPVGIQFYSIDFPGAPKSPQHPGGHDRIGYDEEESEIPYNKEAVDKLFPLDKNDPSYV